MDAVDCFVDLLTELLHFLVILAKSFNVHKVRLDLLLELTNLAFARLHEQRLVHSLHALLDVVQSLHESVCFRQKVLESGDEQSFEFVDVVNAAKLVDIALQLFHLFLRDRLLEPVFKRFLDIVDELVAAVDLVL